MTSFPDGTMYLWDPPGRGIDVKKLATADGADIVPVCESVADWRSPS